MSVFRIYKSKRDESLNLNKNQIKPNKNFPNDFS